MSHHFMWVPFSKCRTHIDLNQLKTFFEYKYSQRPLIGIHVSYLPNKIINPNILVTKMSNILKTDRGTKLVDIK